jgi:hypothetical protein
MSSVYFDPAVGGDGSTVTDDSNASTGLANGGHRTRFVPAMAQVVAVADFVVTQAAAADADATAADNARIAAQAAQAGAEAALDQLDDRYLGAKASDPTLDNDGNALQEGAFYWNTTTKQQKVWNGTTWVIQTFVPTAATGVSFAPTGDIASNNVQAAIAELDTEKANLAYVNAQIAAIPSPWLTVRGKVYFLSGG